MDNLRFLIVDNLKCKDNNNKVHGFEGLEFDFAELRCFCWDVYPFTSLPLKFYPENLVVLEMRNNNLEQLRTGIKNLVNLKYIDLSYSKHLRKVSDLSQFPYLESLILEDCTSLFEITPPSQNLNKLVNLNLKNCKNLISLPIGIQSKSLRDVILSGCSNLNIAPSISCNIERLCLDGTAIKELSSSIECHSKLVELNLKDCLRFESLPSSLCNLKSLRHLNLSGLSNLKTVPEIPPKIEELYLDRTAIKELSSSIENVSNLIKLDLRNCSNLESLPNGIGKLKSLNYLNISGCSKLCRLPKDIGNLESLEVLEANGVTIRELPSSMVRLKNLHDLSFERWKSQEPVSSLSPILSGLQFLRRLNLNNCSLTELPNNLDQLPLLRDLELEGNNFESVPTNIINLSKLRLLNIRFCNKLQSLPKLSRNIQDLKADGCKLLKALSGLTIPCQGYYKRTLSFINCFNLDWNVLRNILKDSVLKMYSDRTLWLEVIEGVGSREGCMCFPGSEIPEWFDIQSSGSSIELPKGSFNQKFLGCVFCTIVGFPDYHRFYNDMVIRTSEFHEFPCDTEAIIIFNSPGSVIKKCGLHLLFTQGIEEPMKRSRFSIFDEDEAHSKRLKSSNFFEGESSSRSELHLVPHEKEVVEEFNPSTNESSSFTLLDLDEFSQDFVGSTMDLTATTTLQPTDNDGVESSTGSGCYYDEDEVINHN
ncbi:disease resistance-like protein DSC1 [Pistacia vera]|uniref:disease resistance-like protein DSC1 n=1 Tax=Pistacia vera TaxID=55513 RepID=UPI001263CACE|nr:disease resistance-like protein DSC1 [Pistacia vera]